MKKLIAVLAVLGFVPYAHAADGADFSHSGEFRLQYQNDMNMDGNDDAPDSPDQNWHQRLRWGTDVRAGEKLTGHFTLVHNADWGSNPDQTPDDASHVDDQAGPAELASASTNNLLIVNEAYMSWMVNDTWMIRAGRGSMTIADGRFVSANEYEAVARAFDGAMASYDHEMARFNFFGVVGAKEDAFNSFGNFYGVSADFKTLPSFLKAANVHIVQIKTDAGTIMGTAVPKETNMRIGAMVSGDMSGVDYRLNYEMEDGETEIGGVKNDISTSMMDAEVGYTLPSMMNTRIFANYHTDSGSSKGAPVVATANNDNETYDGFHYDTHANAGLMDVVEWGNLTYMSLGATMAPMDDVSVGLNYLIFTQTEKKDDVMGSSLFAGTFDPAKDEIGTELDVWVTKKYTNNFNITARYGMFSPGDEYKLAGMEDDYSQVYLESKLTF